MLGYKLFRLMSVLGEGELPEVEKFLQSPFHNTNKDCTLLFRRLCKFHPGMDSTRLTKEFLFARLYGQAAYDDGKMRKLMARLTGLLERFLTIRALEGSEETSNKMLIQSLGDRSDYGLFKAAVDSRIKALEQRPERGREFFQEMYQLYQALFFHPETSKFTVRHDYFQPYISNIERFFTLAALQSGTESIIRRRTLKWDGQIYYLEAADQIAMNTDMAQVPVVNFFHQVFRLYYAPQEAADLTRLKEALTGCFAQMGFDEQRLALKVLINYAIPRSNDGSMEHAKFMFELFRIGIEKNMLIIGGSAVNTDLFMNITTTGLLVRELAWTKDFMKKYGGLLAEEDRFLALQFCKANWHYHNGLYLDDMGEFEKSLQALNLIPVRASENFDLRARSLQLRVSYEVFKRKADILDNILAQAKNFRRHIAANHTYSEAKKDTYFNFIKHYSVLARLANDLDLQPPAVEKALLELNADKYCLLRRWLNEKLKELLNT